MSGRLFAYNSGHTYVTGAIIKGDLSIQTGSDIDKNALPWWMGPNEDTYPWIIASSLLGISATPSTPPVAWE